MSNNNEQNFIKLLNQIQLSVAERERVRGELEEYVDSNQSTVSPWMSVFSPLQNLQKPALVVAMLFFLIGGVSLTAEDALPEDPLYVVKLNINERVMALLSQNNDVSVAQNQSLITSRRIAELEQLAARGVLNPDVSRSLTIAISKHIESAREHIKAASEAGEVSSALSLEIELVSTLNIHGDILEQLGSKNDGSLATTTIAAATELRRFARSKADDDVSTAVAQPQKVQVRANDKDSISPEQAKKLLERTADRLDDVKSSFYNNLKLFANETFSSSLERLLLQSADNIEIAMSALGDEDHDKMKNSLKKALTYAHEVSILMEVYESLDLTQPNEIGEVSERDTQFERNVATTTNGEVQGTFTVTTTEVGETESVSSSTESLIDNDAGDVQLRESSSSSIVEQGAVKSSSATSPIGTTTVASSSITVPDVGTSTATGTLSFNAKKDWSIDSASYVRITDILDQVDMILLEPKTGQDGDNLPGRSLPTEENKDNL